MSRKLDFEGPEIGLSLDVQAFDETIQIAGCENRRRQKEGKRYYEEKGYNTIKSIMDELGMSKK